MEKSVFPWLLRFTHVLEIGVCSIHLHVVSNGFMTVDILLLGEWKRWSSIGRERRRWQGSTVSIQGLNDLIALLCGQQCVEESGDPLFYCKLYFSHANPSILSWHWMMETLGPGKKHLAYPLVNLTYPLVNLAYPLVNLAYPLVNLAYPFSLISSMFAAVSKSSYGYSLELYLKQITVHIRVCTVLDFVGWRDSGGGGVEEGWWRWGSGGGVVEEGWWRRGGGGGVEEV